MMDSARRQRLARDDRRSADRLPAGDRSTSPPPRPRSRACAPRTQPPSTSAIPCSATSRAASTSTRRPRTPSAEHLIPLCDVATPNLFELAWLADVEVERPRQRLRRRPRCSTPRACSRPPSRRPMNGSRRCSSHADAAHASFVPRRSAAPHGTGDLIAALYLGHVLNGAVPESSLGRAAAAVEACIAASQGREELALADKAWRVAPAAADDRDLTTGGARRAWRTQKAREPTRCRRARLLPARGGGRHRAARRPPFSRSSCRTRRRAISTTRCSKRRSC